MATAVGFEYKNQGLKIASKNLDFGGLKTKNLKVQILGL